MQQLQLQLIRYAEFMQNNKDALADCIQNSLLPYDLVRGLIYHGVELVIFVQIYYF